MRTVLASTLIFLAFAASAQTKIDKTVPVTKGQTIRLWFDYPELVRVSTWDKNEISITGSVSINAGESDDAFSLDIRTSSNTITIKNEIKNMDNLPQRITINEGGSKIVFKSKSDWRKYQEEHGKSQNVSMGLDMEIVLDIKVPRNVETNVECVYGMVEIREFNGPLWVQATYGGVDASLVEKNVGELIAETNYGNIYSNLDMEVNKDQAREEDFHMLVKANPGTGPKYRFESPYGNVYLRKGK
jgi:hypothetical protein